jgi:hypothetical protein
MSDPHAITDLNELFTLARKSQDLWKDDASLFHKVISKAATTAADAVDSNQGRTSGLRYHLMDKKTARELRNFNPHHAASLAAKVDSSVSLGHRDQEIHDILDPLCIFNWQDTLDAVAQDLVEGGDGYLEVVRASSQVDAPIVALYHVDATEVYVNVEEVDNGRDFHYVVEGEHYGSKTTVMSKFGDLLNLRRRFGAPRRGRRARNQKTASSLAGTIVNSEIIHFRMPTNRSRYYGYPDYMSAVPSIELVQCMTQDRFDFFFNRGVPEFLMFMIGKNIPTETWDDVKKLMKAQQGGGNGHKSGALHIPGLPAETAIQVEKLAMDQRGDAMFKNESEVLAMNIVTAHQIPPILAGVMVPGKMGGNNEGPNALMLFQKQKLGKIQRSVSSTLACTLGLDGTVFNNPDGEEKVLTRDQFLAKGEGAMDEEGMPQHVSPGNGFRTVLDGMSLGAMETLATMREPLAGSDRDLEDGKLEGQDDRRPTDPKGR